MFPLSGMDNQEDLYHNFTIVFLFSINKLSIKVIEKINIQELTPSIVKNVKMQEGSTKKLLKSL